MTIRYGLKTRSGEPVANAGQRTAGGTTGFTCYEQEFTSPGTWTRPPTVSWVEVLIVGGGGGAGQVIGGGGGGVGIFEVPVSAPVPVTVGAGGTGYTPTSPTIPAIVPATAGGTSSFGSDSVGGGGGGGLSPLTAIGGGGSSSSAVNNGYFGTTARSFTYAGIPTPIGGPFPLTVPGGASAPYIASTSIGTSTTDNECASGDSLYGYGAGGTSIADVEAKEIYVKDRIWSGRGYAYDTISAPPTQPTLASNLGSGGNAYHRPLFPAGTAAQSGSSGIVIVRWFE